MRRRISAIGSGLLLLLAVSCAPSTHVYRVGDTAVLQGKVVAEPYFGPPNYSEDPQTDQREVAYILQLSSPVTIIDSSGVLKSVKEIQISNGNHPTVPSQPLTATGQLYEKVSGHHRRDFLLLCPPQ